MSSVKLLIIWGILFSSARMLIGGFSALFLLSRGLSISEIAYLKGFQAIVILTTDIPFGYFADRYSKKMSVFMGLFCGSLWMLTTAYSPNILWLYIGEFFNALSMALFNGAFDALLIEQFKKEHPKKDLKFLFGSFGKYSFFFMSLAVLIGGLSPSTHSSLFWWIGGVILLVSSVLFLCFFPASDNSNKQRNFFDDFIKIRRYFSFKLQPVLICYIIISVIVGFFYQIFIQYWQIIISTLTLTENALFYSIIFFIILLVQSWSGAIVKKIQSFNEGISNIFLILNLGILAVGIFLKNEYFAILSIIAFFFLYRIMALLIHAHMNEIIDGDIRSTFLSIESSIMRILLFAVSPLIAFALNTWGLFFLPLKGVVIFLISILILISIKKIRLKTN